MSFFRNAEHPWRPWLWLACCAILAAAPTPARALDIQLASGDWQPIKIFIEIFPGEEKLQGQGPSDIVGNDLSVSGNFRVFKETTNSLAVIKNNNQRLVDIRNKGGEYLLTGQVFQLADNQHELRFVLADTLTESMIGDYRIKFSAATKRLAAHQVANWIYEEVTGRPGVFHTKVVYVHRQQADGVEKNSLKIADYDGYGRQTVLSSDNALISPAWTPDGNGILYVSFERDKPIIYRQSLLTGERQIIANFKGSNSAPAVAPNNNLMAAALTEHGGIQQIYLLSDNRKNQMRSSNGIDTEPSFSPDGNKIVFTSDQSGAPQIYEYDLEKNTDRRLTFGSSYNVSPRYAADGKNIVYIRRDENGNNIAVQDLISERFTVLTDIGLTDSPSFAPNDDIVLFKNERRKNYLATVSINGKVLVYWSKPEDGNIIDPSWSPLRSDWF